MNRTVELVNEWAIFEAQHPSASIEDFCRYYLTVQKSKEVSGPNFGGGGIPPNANSFLMKLMGFLCRASQVYYEKAFERIPEIKQKEDFYFLNHISFKKECRKTDVINEQLFGLTTGIDTLNRLINQELILERPHPTDKRAKLVRLTPKGQEVLQRCYEMTRMANNILLFNMSEDDVKLCIQLLRSTEAKHSSMIFDFKDKPIEAIYEEVTGQKPE